MPSVNDRESRGYGRRHKTERAKWEPMVKRGEARCARCHQPIAPDQPWDLGHTDDRTAYTGPECVPCNRGAGGRNGAAVTNSKRAMTVREW